MSVVILLRLIDSHSSDTMILDFFKIELIIWWFLQEPELNDEHTHHEKLIVSYFFYELCMSYVCVFYQKKYDTLSFSWWISSFLSLKKNLIEFCPWLIVSEKNTEMNLFILMVTHSWHYLKNYEFFFKALINSWYIKTINIRL